MTQFEKVAISLTPKMADVIRDAVDSGEYASAGEVMREALRMWSAKRKVEKMRMDGIAQSLAAGTVRFMASEGDLTPIEDLPAPTGKPRR